MKKFIVFLLLLIIISASSVFAKSYSDLPTTHWAYVPINEMTQRGILTGYPDGSFAPDKTITRAEFAKILVLALNLQESSNNVNFNDVSSDHWAYSYIKTASNYLSGYSNGDILLYVPDGIAVREDMAVAVVNAIGLQNSNYDLNTLNRFSDKDLISENLKKYIAIAVENGLMNGNTNGTFNPKGGLTRAEVSKLITNTMEKVVISENYGEEIKLPDFKYNADTATIDLGEDWQKYYYTYDKINAINGYYTPTQRILSYDMEEKYEYETGKKPNSFWGKYVFVISKYDKSVYKRIDISKPFEDVKFNFDKGQVDLGKNWKKYVYDYSLSSNPGSDALYMYTPSQRKLKAIDYDSSSSKKGEYRSYGKFVILDNVYVKVYLKENQDIYIYSNITKDDIDLYRAYVNNKQEQEKEEEENAIKLPNFKYDSKTATIDLGEDWQKYYYTYDTINAINGYYTPTQRILSYDMEEKYEYEAGKKPNSFWGKYVFIMSKDDRNVYKRISISKPFEDVKFNFDVGEVDLESNWEKYVYSYSYSTVPEKYKYTPTQRKLVGINGLKDENGSGTVLSSSNNGLRLNYRFVMLQGQYVKVYLKDNEDIYIKANVTASNVKKYQEYLLKNQTDDDNEIKLPEFKYDIKTGTIDLGENWQDYLYSYNISNKIGLIYEPSQRTLYYILDKRDNVIGDFGGLYAFVISKKDQSVYKTIKVKDPFDGVKFDFAKGEVDLGSNWNNYLVSFVGRGDYHFNKYLPANRVIKGTRGEWSSGTEKRDGFGIIDDYPLQSDFEFIVYLRNNNDLFITKKITIDDVNKYDESLNAESIALRNNINSIFTLNQKFLVSNFITKNNIYLFGKNVLY